MKEAGVHLRDIYLLHGKSSYGHQGGGHWGRVKVAQTQEG